MSIWQAALLGIIQGLTEFLPVSSSGHLVLSQALLGLELPGVTFEVVVHMATLCAVLWVYRVRVASLASGALSGKREAWNYIGLLVLASIPAAIAGIAGEDFFTTMFGRPAWTALFLIVTGFIVWSIHTTAPRATYITVRPSRWSFSPTPAMDEVSTPWSASNSGRPTQTLLPSLVRPVTPRPVMA